MSHSAIVPGLIVPLAEPPKNQAPVRFSFFSVTGVPLITMTAAPTGGNILLTGFTAETAAALAATDTVNEALAKLEARVVALEGA